MWADLCFTDPLVHGSEPENDTRAAATTITAVDGIMIELWFFSWVSIAMTATELRGLRQQQRDWNNSTTAGYNDDIIYLKYYIIILSLL